MRTTLLALAAAAALATPAMANQCPALIAQLNALLAEATALDADTRTAVEAMVAEGQAAHDAGDHASSEATLLAALAMLGQ